MTKNNLLQTQSDQLTGLVHSLTEEEANRSLKQDKVDYTGRHQRYLKALILTNNLLTKVPPSTQSLMEQIILHHNYVKKKSEDFVLILYHFKNKDYQAEFILDLLCEKTLPHNKVSLYLKTRSAVLKSYRAQKNREYISNVSYNFDEWFNLILPIYPQVKPTKLVSMFSEGVKDLYRRQSRNEESYMTGADILRIGIENLISLYEEPVSRKTNRSVTPRKEIVHSPLKNVPSTVITSLKPTKQVIEDRQTELIDKITVQVEDLRNALGRQRSRIMQLTQRQKYFVSMIGKLKDQFCNLAQAIHTNRVPFRDYGLLQPMIDNFKQFQSHVSRRQSLQIRTLEERQAQLTLIRQIQEEQNSSYPYNGADM